MPDTSTIVPVLLAVIWVCLVVLAVFPDPRKDD